MYKKRVELKKQLQADKAQLEADVTELRAVIDQPDPALFDEFAAASRITAAKSKDHLEGGKTADAVAKTVDKERGEAVKKLDAMAGQKADAQKSLPAKQAQLAAVDNELTTLHWQLREFINQAARERLSDAVHTYQQAAGQLLRALIEIDALNAVMADDPNENPAKLVLRVEPLPAVGIDDLTASEPWQLQASGEKLFFPCESAFPAVHNRHLALLEDIKGTLYEQ